MFAKNVHIQISAPVLEPVQFTFEWTVHIWMQIMLDTNNRLWLNLRNSVNNEWQGSPDTFQQQYVVHVE